MLAARYSARLNYNEVNQAFTETVDLFVEEVRGWGKDLISEHVLDFPPQWMKNPPKNLKPKIKGGTMTHPEWVAAWWSRALVQLMAQGHAKKSTLSVETLLVEFLNANKVAAEEFQDVGWEYDKHLWKDTSEKIGAKDKKLDVTEAMTDASEKKISEVQKEMKSSPQGPKGGGKYDSKGKGKYEGKYGGYEPKGGRYQDNSEYQGYQGRNAQWEKPQKKADKKGGKYKGGGKR